MRTLIAEDDLATRLYLELTLKEWGHDVRSAADGGQAFSLFLHEPESCLALLDWAMPGMDGLTICQRLRVERAAKPTYIILLTARTNKPDIIAGLQAGANDYITKPFHLAELRARLQVGQRVLELQSSLAERVRELEIALSRIRQLQGLLPICTYCKKIRDDSDYWQQLESYVSSHSDARFSHGVCPECYERHLQPQITDLNGDFTQPTRCLLPANDPRY